MNRKERRALGPTSSVTVSQLVRALEGFGPILWEPDPTEGRREGWAVCPCCGERDLWVSLPLDDDAQVGGLREAS